MSNGMMSDETPRDDTEHPRKPRRAPRARQRDAEAATGAPPEPATGTQAFEEAVARLDEIVAQLEGGQLPLDQSLTLFEEGVRLYQHCQRLLDSAELRLERLRFSVDIPPAAVPDDADDGLFLVETFDLDER